MPDPAPRARDDRLRGIAATGGVICVDFVAGFLTEDTAQVRLDHLLDHIDHIDHIEHVAAVAGIDHVGLGPDFIHEAYTELVPPWCEDLGAMAGFDVPAAIPGLTGPRGLPQVTRRLLDHGQGGRRQGAGRQRDAPVPRRTGPSWFVIPYFVKPL